MVDEMCTKMLDSARHGGVDARQLNAVVRRAVGGSLPSYLVLTTHRSVTGCVLGA